MTPKSVAKAIDTLQPNLKEFNKSLTTEISDTIYDLILAETDINLKLLKAELFLMYFTTHRIKYAGTSMKYIVKLLCNTFNFTLNTNTYSNEFYYKAQDYNVSNAELTDEFILFHVTNNKQYLPEYLKRKIYPSVSNIQLKEPKDDALSLMAFKTYITNLSKGLSSVEAQKYIEKVRFFYDTKEDYITLILDNCKKPSIKFQKYLEILSGLYSSEVTKYMYLSKHDIYSLAWQLKVRTAASVFDEQHSVYKPFITNLNRNTTPDDKQFSYLVSALTLLKTSNELKPNPVYQHFIDALTTHLEHPDYKEPWKIYLQQLNAQTNAITELAKHFKD